MSLFGFLLIFLSLPLFVIYGMTDEDKRNRKHLRLGFLLAGVGAVIAVLPN